MKNKLKLLSISILLFLSACTFPVRADQKMIVPRNKSETAPPQEQKEASKVPEETENSSGDPADSKDSSENPPGSEDSPEDSADGGDSPEEPADDKEPQLPEEKPADQMYLPEILFEEADGKNGYYLSRPEVQIIHREPDAITKYELRTEDDACKSGSLELAEEEEEETSLILSGDYFKNGDNILHVWMERTQKTENEGDLPESPEEGADQNIIFSKEFHFRIDSGKPAAVTFSYGRAANGTWILANEPLEIALKSEDSVSGIEKIQYQTSTGDTGTLPGGTGKIQIPPGFSGKISACAMDKAGNSSGQTESLHILCENLSPEIQILTQSQENSWYSRPVDVHVKVSDSPLSSGIRSLKCYSNGQVIVHKENGKAGEVTELEADFTVDSASEKGIGIPVIAETIDWAGNSCTEHTLLYIDTVPPVIQSEKIHDQMITGKPLAGKIRIQEENILAGAKLQIWRIHTDESRKLLDTRETDAGNSGFLSGSQGPEWDILLTEDGKYEICASAEDLSGHKTEKSYRITIDKTSPVIRYVDQMQGAYVPYFQWNYGKEELIQDLSDYSYEIRLDGMLYTPGKKITAEGLRLLQVTAADAAGNRSAAEAVFQIDHTPPKIQIYDIENGKAYENHAAISVSVDGKGEYLREIAVNAEKMRLDLECQVFRQTFQEAGDYQIRVLAEDLAGNREREQITFRVEEKKVLSGGVWKPVTRFFRNPQQTSQQIPEDINDDNAENPAPILLGMCFLSIGTAAIIRKFWIKRKST